MSGGSASSESCESFRIAEARRLSLSLSLEETRATVDLSMPRDTTQIEKGHTRMPLIALTRSGDYAMTTFVNFRPRKPHRLLFHQKRNIVKRDRARDARSTRAKSYEGVPSAIYFSSTLNSTRNSEHNMPAREEHPEHPVQYIERVRVFSLSLSLSLSLSFSRSLVRRSPVRIVRPRNASRFSLSKRSFLKRRRKSKPRR